MQNAPNNSDLYRQVRDALVERTGAWSANSVYLASIAFGVRGRRTNMLREIKEACGQSGCKPGRRQGALSRRVRPSGIRRILNNTGLRTKRVGLSPSTRFIVLTRDNFTFRYCGRRSPDVTLHVDHVIPVVDGGSNQIHNLVTACDICNLGKGKLRISAIYKDGLETESRNPVK
jgi:hypothetical protein